MSDLLVNCNFIIINDVLFFIMSYQSEVKIVFLGDSTVGKTSIISSFSHGEFIADQTPTIGVCFSLQKIEIGGEIIKMKIWDTAGQEKFRSLTPFYYRDSDLVIFVFAIDSKDSFEGIKVWYENVKKDTTKLPKLMVVGNKIDLSDKRKVPIEECECFADTIGATYMECSAKSGQGIEDIFTEAGNILLNEREKIKLCKESETNTVINSEKKESPCCSI